MPQFGRFCRIILILAYSSPFSDGPLGLSFQRPVEACRTFASPAVEQVIDDITSHMVDKDLAQLFRNSFPNTLDTTVRWHTDGSHRTTSSERDARKRDGPLWNGPQTFIVTGDINAEWLRDSTNQLAAYQGLAKKDKNLRTLIVGAINTQVEYVIQSPYCNAFQPPPLSGIPPSDNGQKDTVHPAFEPSFVFECKYELDSLANFLSLGTQFYEHTGSTEFVTDRWYAALKTVLNTLMAQSMPTFNDFNQFVTNQYTFQRVTTAGTETLNLGGVGNPLNQKTGLIRSAFRPSDDATILGFFIPPNAMMAVQLKKTAEVVKAAGGNNLLVQKLQKQGQDLAKAVWEHGVVKHRKYGDVFAFEVDGYGSQVLMDDANIPSLLSLPFLGFVSQTDPVYLNTRRMILSKDGNPYYLSGQAFRGIGGPHSMCCFLPSYVYMRLTILSTFSWSSKRLAHVTSRTGIDQRIGFGDHGINQSRAQFQSSRPGARVYQRRQYPSVYSAVVCMGEFGLFTDYSQSCRDETLFDFWSGCKSVRS